MKDLPDLIYKQFPAFKYKNYRLYFFGQLVSFTGSWLHGVAHGWLVYQLTNSPFWLGAVSAISSLPVLVLSLFGGFLVDRFNRKKLLIVTQSTMLVCAFVLGVLTLLHLITLPLLLVITFISGIANAIDNPVTQAFVVDVVSKDDLPSAVGLNSLMFNTGKVLGPAAAGYLIAFIGVGNIFLINAASFLAILGSLYFIHIKHFSRNKKKENPVRAIREGITYSYAHPLISILLMTAGIGAVFCFSQATIMPVLAKSIFRGGSTALGTLLSAMGIGALFGSFIISSQSKKISAFLLIAAGNILFMSSSLFFSFLTDIRLAAVCLFFTGMGLTLQFSTIYTTIQRLVREEYRGRVSSIYVMLFVGFSPLGNLFIGSTATWFGPQTAIRLGLFITFLYELALLYRLPKVRRKYILYKNKPEPQYVFTGPANQSTSEPEN